MSRNMRPQNAQDPSEDGVLIERIRAASAALQPGQVEEGRARLLQAVAQRRAASQVLAERTSLVGLVIGRKRLAFVAAGLLAVGAASAVGASGGVSDAAGNVDDVLAALHITERTPDVADEHIDAAEQPGGADDATEASPDEHANENASQGADNADDGIANGNASETGLDNAADNAALGSDNADDLPDEADDHADGPPDAGGASLPDLPEDADGALENVDPGVPADAAAKDHADLPDEASDPPAPLP